MIFFGIYKAIRVAVMHAHYDGQAEIMFLLLKQHCHESSSISPCLVALCYMIEAKGAYKGIHP